MNVINDAPCNNKQIIALAQNANIGDVLLYKDGLFQWLPREELKGWYLTITINGYELINEDGKSQGLINLGVPYFGVDTDGACHSCDKTYDFYIPAVCIPDPPTPDDDYGYGRCQDIWVIEWCLLCNCEGITNVDGEEQQLSTQTDELYLVYNFDLRAHCDCAGKNITSITKIESPM